jgi:glycosyltransferase involved in cell wall biosynthesis
MRVAVVGPTHPYKGGVAAHTTQAAHQLAATGHDVRLVSWSRLYPARLYPGEQAVPDGGPDLPPYPRTVRVLRWDRPGSWWRTGRRLRDVDVLVVVVVVPVQVPALLALIRAARSGRRHTPGHAADRPRVVVLAHNIVPHERQPGGEWLMSRLLRTADAVLVHSARMAEQAREHGARDVAIADLPPHPPGGVPTADDRDRARRAADARASAGEPVAVLALGMVREYKGVDLLLRAAREVPGVRVTVAGEQWGRPGADVRELAADPRLAGRVALSPGYVPGVEIPALLADHDVLALPYRHATASQNVLLAHLHGLPVIASRTGTFPRAVRDGVDGLLVEPGDVLALTAALRTVADRERLAALRAGVPVIDVEAAWQAYLAALVGDVPEVLERDDVEPGPAIR